LGPIALPPSPILDPSFLMSGRGRRLDNERLRRGRDDRDGLGGRRRVRLPEAAGRRATGVHAGGRVRRLAGRVIAREDRLALGRRRCARARGVDIPAGDALLTARASGGGLENHRRACRGGGDHRG